MLMAVSVPFIVGLRIAILFIEELIESTVMFVNTIPYIMCISLVSSNIGGFTKKATCGVSHLRSWPVIRVEQSSNRRQVMMFMAYSVGQIITPQFFLARESPRYPTGFRAVYVSVSLMIVIEIALM